MPKPATLQSIASNLKLSKTTVSVALRGRPGVSKEIRAQIIAEAARQGYEVNPAAAELMGIVRTQLTKKSGDTIAFINTFHEDPSLLNRVHSFRMFFEGAQEQAKVFGYLIEEFRVADFGPGSARLDRELKARGIRGVLLGPRWMSEPDIQLDWPAYSCALIGETAYGARIHRVCNHHPHTLEQALTNLVGLGYRRIGVELLSEYESSRHFDYFAGIAPARFKVGRKAKFFVRINPYAPIPGINRLAADQRDQFAQEYTNRYRIPKLEQWIQKENLDALVTLHGYDLKRISLIQTTRGRPLGYARLDVQPSEGCAGVNEHSDDIGRTAVHLLRGVLHAGERGVVPTPRIVLIEGEWIDGPTAPRISP